MGDLEDTIERYRQYNDEQERRHGLPSAASHDSVRLREATARLRESNDVLDRSLRKVARKVNGAFTLALCSLLLSSSMACGGGDPTLGAGAESVGSAPTVDAGDVDAGDAGRGPLDDAGDVDAGDAGAVLDDAGDVDARAEQLDAGDAGAVLDDAGDVDARACLVVTGYGCHVAGYPYPATCAGLSCCCVTYHCCM